jgi:D-alanyl-D-alanine carboxypeptidase
MKTGYTNKSKYSLIATAKRGNRRILSVVLGAANKDIRASVAAQMLDRGFNTFGAKTESREYRVESNKANTNQLSTLYSASEASNTLRANGATGIQFGAFGSRGAAETHVAKVSKLFGVNAGIETAPNGMFRVRANGLSENSAQQIKSQCAGNGIECFVFH